jgi:hypothetical protein
MARQARLHHAVEGVDVCVDVRGKPVKAIIAREALQERFAAGASPQSWLDAYLRHADVIDPLIVQRFRNERRQPVIMGPADF